MRIFLVFIFITIASAQLCAQGYYWQGAKKQKRIQHLSIEAGLGLRMFFGDVQTSGSQFNKINLAYGLGARYQLKPRWGVALQLGGRKYRGEKEHATAFAYTRMDGKLWEGMLTAQFSWLAWEDFTLRQFTERDPVTKSNVFIGSGIGAAQFSASYVSNYLAASDSVVIEYDGGSASGIAVFIPFTFGYRYRFDPSWSLGFELTYITYLADNLDAFERQRRDSMCKFTIRMSYTLGQKNWIRK